MWLLVGPMVEVITFEEARTVLAASPGHAVGSKSLSPPPLGAERRSSDHERRRKNNDIFW